MWKQWLVALCLVAVAVAGAMVYLNLSEGDAAQASRQRPPAAVHTLLPHEERVRDVVNAVGNLKAPDAVELTTEVSGRVVEIHLEAGARVRQGELLLRLDDRQARADIAEIEARLADARRQLERASRLRSNNSISQSQVDELRTAVDVAQAQRQAAQVSLENHRIRAPFEGVVGLSDVSIGAYITAGTRITTLDSTEQMELNFSVPERFLGHVRQGQEVRGSSPAYPGETFEGELVELGTRVDELSRTLPVRARIDNPEGRLRPGQFMSATLTLQQRQALVIPEQAVLVRGDETFVFVARDGVARRTSVTLGSRKPGLVEVVSGLAPDDPVIVTGQDRLSSGDRIRVLEGDNAIPPNRFDPARES
jgi:membrane fusion protein (multidrug efflux system)